MNAAAQFPSGNGQSHTHAVILTDGRQNPFYKAGQPYPTVTLDRVRAMVESPSTLPKEGALWFISSTYAEHDARCHDAQREHGQFHCLPVDIDCNDLPLSDVQDAVRAVIGEAAAIYYATRSAKPDDRRWRVLIPLAQPISGRDYKDTQDAFFDLLEETSGGVLIPDRALNRAAQLVYLPNIGAAGFYEYALPDTSAPVLALTPDSAITVQREANAEALRQAEQEAKAARERRVAERKARTVSDGLSPVEHFNAKHSVADLLERYGYKRDGRSNNWRSPSQTSGSYATRDYGDYWVSLSGSDAAQAIGQQTKNGYRFGDAFDLFVHYGHDGNFKAAVCSYALEAVLDKGQTFDDGEAADKATNDGISGSADDNDKVDPIDLWCRFDPPELPQGLLPPIIEQFARINAEHMGADPAAFAMSALTVCAAAIPDAIKLKARRHSDYLESARIWTVLVGEPSTKKTPSMAKAKAPLERLNFNLIGENSRRMAEWQKEKKDGSDAPKPQCPRLILNDATTEAAQEALKDSPNGMLLFQDELSGFFGRIEKYGGGAKAGSADRGFWLQAYNGGAYAVDRVSRGAFVIENVSVCLLGGIQFDPIRRVANESLDDGLIQRINPILLRRPKLGNDAPQPEINADYHALIEKLTHAKTVFQLWPNAPITFDDDALAICHEIEEFKLGLADIEGTNPKLATHLAKYEGLFVRYCLLFHCIENIDAPGDVPLVVQGELAERVRRFLFDYVMKHARAFYVELIGMAEGHDDLEKLAGYILTKRLDKVTERDIQRSTGGKGGLTKIEAQTLAEKMESLGWLQRIGTNRVGAPLFTVNPRVHAKFQNKAKTETERRKRAQAMLANLASG